MKAIKSLVVAAIAAVGVSGMMDAQAARGGGGHSGAAVHGGGGGHGGGSHGGGGHGGGGHWGGGGHGHGGHGHYYGHSHYYYGGGYYPYYWWGWPLAWSAAWYWGSPYYYNAYYYPQSAYYYDRYAAPYPDGVMEPSAPPPTTEVPRSQGAPMQAPAYMNYCDSSKAYYPKVTSCPEGWKFIPSR
jgi:hypothetical protein